MNTNQLITDQISRAMARYHRRYDNKLYNAACPRSTSDATQQDFDRYNALIDEAMAICGHPNYQVNQDAQWNADELDFLSSFVETPTQFELRDREGLTPIQKDAVRCLENRGLFNEAEDARRHWANGLRYELPWACFLTVHPRADDYDMIRLGNACL